VGKQTLHGTKAKSIMENRAHTIDKAFKLIEGMKSDFEKLGDGN